MRGLALEYPSRNLREVEVAEPVLRGPHDVLFRVLEIGVCGTDRALVAGHFEYAPVGEQRLILGHEALGEVIAVGPEVTGIRAGDLVTPMVRRRCVPGCRFCAADRRDLCITGDYTERGIMGAHGYFAELAVDDERDLVVVPAALRESAVLMEPLSVVEKAVRLALRSYEGKPQQALVIGAGPIGILTALVLMSRGIAVVVHSLEPPDSPRAQWLISCGAGYCQSDPPEADIVMEAAGGTAAGFLAVRKLRPAGVAVILGALNAAGDFPFRDLILGNRTVVGAVNADRAAFLSAAEDLQRIGISQLRPMVERVKASEWRRTMLGEPSGRAPKWVHVWG